MKNTILLLVSCALLALMLAVGCEKQETKTYGSLEEALEYALTPGADLSQEVELEGYYWFDGAPMIITDLSLLDVNAALPLTSYVVITGDGLQKINGNTDFLGARVKFKGKLEVEVTTTKALLILFRCPDLPVLLQPRRAEVQLPLKGSFCERFPNICNFTFTPIAGKYALLYSGGVNQANAHRRYWNDLQFMYAVLREQYGYSEENIVVVYKDGNAENAGMDVDFAATPTGVEAALSYLQERMTTNDDLFVFVTNHGGGLHRGGGHQNRQDVRSAGLPDNNLDEQEPEAVDEVIYFYNSNPIELSDDDFRLVLNALPHKQLVVVMEPCFSGGFIRDIGTSGGVVISACQDDELSYGGLMIDGVAFDVFSYYFTEALKGSDVSGTPLSTNPDTNGNGRVSMLEAFEYARVKDTQNETPMLDADGDGIGRSTPSNADSDGMAARSIYL